MSKEKDRQTALEWYRRGKAEGRDETVKQLLKLLNIEDVYNRIERLEERLFELEDKND